MRKRSLLAVMMAGVMAFSLAAPAWAESSTEKEERRSLGSMLGSLINGEDTELSGLIEKGSSLLSSLTEEGGALAGIVPEGVDVGSLLNTLGGQLSDENSNLYKGLEELVNSLGSENGEKGFQALGELAGALFGSGDETDMTEEDAQLMQDYMDISAAVKDYVKERHAGELEEGDVQLVIPVTAYSQLSEDGTSYQEMGYYLLENFNRDGEEMTLAGAVGEDMLMTVTKNENGVWEVTAAKVSADGEDYTDSVRNMCEEVGVDFDEYLETTSDRYLPELSAVIGMVEEFPEVKQVEINGELKNVSDLQTELEEAITAVLAALFEDMDSTAEEAVTEGAAAEKAAAEETVAEKAAAEEAATEGITE